ncbi:MAG: twin-arginine translocase subunit TatC [Candidatus Kaelpia imicola]|nr:twin-arginine translocase subunit TatC [Candidatus Kaelpia imicola]
MTVFDHLEEFRRRLIYILVFYFLSVVICYLFVDDLLLFIQKPVTKLIYIHPAELFIVRIKIALSLGAFATFTCFISQLYLYIKPALRESSLKTSFLYIFSIVLFFYSGIVLGYLLFLPCFLNFLLNFEAGNISAMITVSNYISFLFMLLLSFGIISIIPLAVLFSVRSGLVEAGVLKRGRKYIYLASFILAALLTPPDVFTQVILALPLILLFELSILISSFSVYNSSKR